jgi:hypothetical protein
LKHLGFEAPDPKRRRNPASEMTSLRWAVSTIGLRLDLQYRLSGKKI